MSRTNLQIHILIEIITLYFQIRCIILNMAMFCLNIFSINHLQNLSSYEIVYGRKPRAITDLQLEVDILTHPTFYHFSDYLGLLNEWVHTIRDIVKEHHNQTIQKMISTTELTESYTEIIQWRWYSLLSFSITNYYLWPKTTFQKIANVFCWTVIHFL